VGGRPGEVVGGLPDFSVRIEAQEIPSPGAALPIELPGQAMGHHIQKASQDDAQEGAKEGEGSGVIE
jgi:hypothetical protein